MKRRTTGAKLELPAWAREVLRPDKAYPGDRDKMALAVRLSELNVRRGTGGPFGAAVFEDPGGRLLSVGVNAVLVNRCSLAHAEIMALAAAQRRMRRHRLNGRSGRQVVLASSAQPCLMCLGAILWAGVDRILYAARGTDVERLTGFDEGPLPRDWRGELRRRGIRVEGVLMRREACRVLRMYREKGGPLY
ncbi:MAG: nucleoside deaminase [Candidatus Aminicenantes bacterium]|nr:nucleoside deaminase [Candidatus Aminicenantes bacterium]